MNFLETLLHNIHTKKENKSFCIDSIFYTYQDLGNAIGKIVDELNINKKYIKNKRVAVVCTNHINTYAGLIACWMSGYAYVPLGLHNPDERNKSILEDAEIGIILSSKQLYLKVYSNFKIIDISSIVNESNSFSMNSDIGEDDLSYILFTSGSTGKPKGVPITFKNLSSFLESFNKSPVVFKNTDRCLQMYDLTFDLSISSYLAPLLAGACVYTISDEGVKYINVLKTINEHKLTILQYVPSVIKLGSPLLGRLNFEFVKYCLLGGEATTFDLLQKMEILMPNAEIYNYYGPTEATIYCSFHLYNSKRSKLYNGMLAIGKPFINTDLVIVNPETLKPVKTLEKGELLIAGNQITNGYLNNPQKNKESFLQIEYQNRSKTYYRSGDMCYKDDDGDIYYCGRYDNQVKIQGFRVELSEIEFKVRQIFSINNVAITYVNKVNATEIILVVEAVTKDKNNTIIQKLKEELPEYMIPKDIILITEFPINTSGKTDRVKVKQFVNEYYSKL